VRKLRPNPTRRHTKRYRLAQLAGARYLLERAFEEPRQRFNRTAQEPEQIPQPLVLPPEPPLEHQPPSPTASISSLLTYRITPDTPPYSPLPSPSYSPISSPPASPANSTASVEFLGEVVNLGSPASSTLSVEFLEEVIGLLDTEISESPPSPTPSIIIENEIHYQPPVRRFYFAPGAFRTLDSLITTFPVAPSPLPESTYAIGPHDFVLEEIRSVLPHLSPDATIPVSLPSTYRNFHLVPKDSFLNVFPPNTAAIEEIFD